MIYVVVTIYMLYHFQNTNLLLQEDRNANSQETFQPQNKLSV